MISTSCSYVTLPMFWEGGERKVGGTEAEEYVRERERGRESEREKERERARARKIAKKKGDSSESNAREQCYSTHPLPRVA